MGSPEPLRLGGQPVATLRSHTGDGIVEAAIAPGRGMMLLQASARVGGRGFDLLDTPPLQDLATRLGGPGDFAGNAAFSFGGAILFPYANRIRGRPLPDRQIEVEVAGRLVRLPMNWGGTAPGAERYAMHGLILDLEVDDWEQPRPDVVHGQLRNHDFGGRWPSRADLDFTWRLAAGRLELEMLVANVGEEAMPVGIGWHPWFRIQSGDRAAARLRAPASHRVVVNNYDEVLPTGELQAIGSSPYDVAQPAGLRLGGQYLDDCFVGLARDDAGAVVVELLDAASGLRLAISSPSSDVQAVQVYAPPDRPVVVIEPQFNWGDPFGQVWGEATGKGMVLLQPGDRVSYRADVAATAMQTRDKA
jgi:aldose 1-epimerase